MNDQRIAVLTDTGSDCPADFAAAHDVRVVPLRINYSDGSSYESGVDISTEEVVRRFEQEIPKTSLPSPERIADELARAKADGYKAAVFVSISSGLSATCDTVRMVARTMDDFPVVVIDTLEIGVAAGATDADILQRMRRKYDKLFFLVPGFEQPGGAQNSAQAFGAAGYGACVIDAAILSAPLRAPNETPRAAIRKAAESAREAILAALPAFRGEIMQTPPMTSAVKTEGRIPALLPFIR